MLDDSPHVLHEQSNHPAAHHLPVAGHQEVDLRGRGAHGKPQPPQAVEHTWGRRCLTRPFFI